MATSVLFKAFSTARKVAEPRRKKDAEMMLVFVSVVEASLVRRSPREQTR